MEHIHAKLLKRFIKDQSLVVERKMSEGWGLSQWKMVVGDTAGTYKFRIRNETTDDLIDWSHVNPMYRYMARDANDNIALYTDDPIMGDGEWVYNEDEYDDHWCMCFAKFEIPFASYKKGTCDWQDSLVARP
jgi:hypothetical protein